MKNQKTLMSKIHDNRINDNHCAQWYINLANEYLADMGRKVTGGWTMSAEKFNTASYAPTRSDMHIYVEIIFATQTISLYA